MQALKKKRVIISGKQAQEVLDSSVTQQRLGEAGMPLELGDLTVRSTKTSPLGKVFGFGETPGVRIPAKKIGVGTGSGEVIIEPKSADQETLAIQFAWNKAMRNYFHSKGDYGDAFTKAIRTFVNAVGSEIEDPYMAFDRKVKVTLNQLNTTLARMHDKITQGRDVSADDLTVFLNTAESYHSLSPMPVDSEKWMESSRRDTVSPPSVNHRPMDTLHKLGIETHGSDSVTLRPNLVFNIPESIRQSNPQLADIKLASKKPGRKVELIRDNTRTIG